MLWPRAGAKARTRSERLGVNGDRDAGRPDGSGVVVGYVAQQEHPHHGQQESAGEEEESGVADGEFQSGAEPWASIHECCQGGRCPVPVSIR